MLQAIQETLPEASALALELIGLRQQIDMLEMKFSELASAFARTSFWEDQGSNSAIDWLRFKCHLTDRAAGDRIAVGDKLAELPQSIDALQHGEIGFAHVATLARTAKAVGEAFDEEQLLELARKHSPGKFYFKSLHYRHAVDAKGFNREQVGLMENRHLNLATADDGCLLISGVIDPIGGAAVRASLEALARPCGKHDHRSREQRLADALVEQATVGAKVQMQVTASVETLLGLVGAPGAENEFSLPTPPAQPRRGDPKQGGAVGVRLQHQPRPSARLRRDRCRPFGANDQGSGRKALIARDQHCQWPGCDRPASWCDAHHLQHWLHGGGGEIENQLLLCGRHHRLVHEGGWQIIKPDGGAVMTIAPTITFGRPRAPD